LDGDSPRRRFGVDSRTPNVQVAVLWAREMNVNRHILLAISVATGVVATLPTRALADQTVEAGQPLALKEDDVPRGGKVDEQADPKFNGPLPDKFPFSDDEIKSGKVTVSKILAFYRTAYSPGAESPLVGTGDPAEGVGTNIGAIGAGKESVADRFGRFGRAKE